MIMNRKENSDSIPIDLIPDILSRLPAKSIGRFRCVSKLWGSLLRKPYFTELFLTRSSARPRLLIGVKQNDEWFLFSSPQPQKPFEKSSLVVAADFHMKISYEIFNDGICRYASGLLYFLDVRISKEDKDGTLAICNPSTGQYEILPRPPTRCRGEGFLGFDPIAKQFKVLINGRLILTLGTEKPRWRTIQPLSKYDSIHVGTGICINGVLYYADYYDGDYFCLNSFDVRSETFKFRQIHPHWLYGCSSKLINCKGKLGVISPEVGYEGGFPLKLHMQVLEDIEKREWSAYVYTIRTEDKVVNDDDYISVVGATALGEIVLVNDEFNPCKPFYVFYFNPERDTLQSVEIQGIRAEGKEWSKDYELDVVVDHIEDFILML